MHWAIFVRVKFLVPPKYTKCIRGMSLLIYSGVNCVLWQGVISKCSHIRSRINSTIFLPSEIQRKPGGPQGHTIILQHVCRIFQLNL